MRGVVENIYARFVQGDFEPLFDALDPDVKWTVHAAHPALGGTGQYHGSDGVRQWFQRLGENMHLTAFTPDAWFVDGVPWSSWGRSTPGWSLRAKRRRRDGRMSGCFATAGWSPSRKSPARRKRTPAPEGQAPVAVSLPPGSTDGGARAFVSPARGSPRQPRGTREATHRRCLRGFAA